MHYPVKPADGAHSVLNKALTQAQIGSMYSITTAVSTSADSRKETQVLPLSA